MQYDILIVIAFIISIIYMMFRSRKKVQIKQKVISLLIVVFCAVIFARIFWVIEKIEYFLSGIYNISEALEFGIGKFKMIGVLVGTIIGMLWVSKIYKDSSKDIRNVVIEGMFLFAALAKFVCAIKGVCCFGKETGIDFGISYPDKNMFNLFPTAYIEASVLFSCFLVLHILKRKIESDQIRISFVFSIYMLIRICLLEGLYANTPIFGDIKDRVIYFIMIISCLVIICINERKYKKI